MDPQTKLAARALLDLLWEGTDLELALAREGLVLRLAKDDEMRYTEEDLAKAAQGAVDTIWSLAREDGVTVMVRETWDGEPFEAISIDDLGSIVESWNDE